MKDRKEVIFGFIKCTLCDNIYIKCKTVNLKLMGKHLEGKYYDAGD